MNTAEIAVGQVVRHPYSRTVTDLDNLTATLGSLNTAQVHFNVEAATELLDGRFRERIVVGSCVLAIVTGLGAAGWGSPYLEERGLSALRFSTPVYAGDTISATSEVLAVGTEPDGAVVAEVRLTGTNQNDETVVTVVRTFGLRR